LNFLTKKRGLLLIFLVPVLLYIGYELFLSRKLSPPADSERITVSFRVPEGVTLLPLGGLYVSSECTNTRFTAAGNTYQADATTGVSLPFVSQGAGNLMSASIEKDGGGRCQWKLSSVQVGFRVSDSNPLVKGKKVIKTRYDFDLLGYGDSGGSFGMGREKEVSGDLNIKTDFFPMITQFTDNDISFEFFGGDTRLQQWVRSFSLTGTRYIAIEPVVHLDKVASLMAPDKTDNWIAIYQDGSRDEIPYIFPDYEKLLSMK
jgi:hypothetical protein